MHTSVTIKLKVLKTKLVFIDGPCKYYTRSESHINRKICVNNTSSHKLLSVVQSGKQASDELIGK
jgi:hypothetical protein